MKKFIFSFIAIFMMVFSAVVAQSVEQTNYSGSSRFTDNWSVSLQGGVVTPFSNFFKNGSITPTVVIGLNKEITPWFGFGVEGRTYIGSGNRYNPYTAFDAVNVSGNVRFNVINLFRKYSGQRYLFEPIVYTGIGWGHSNAYAIIRNYMTYRAGTEFNFNIGKDKEWAVVVNPSVVWGDMPNFKFYKAHANFELTAGVVYRFKNSNGKRHFSKAYLYDATEVERLMARIKDLENRDPEVITKIVEKEVYVTNEAKTITSFVVHFSHDNYKLTETAKNILNVIPEGTTVKLDGYSSLEPRSNKNYNVELSRKRTETVKTYLESRGVKVISSQAHGCNDDFGRVVVVTVQ